jgi:hypothetical protein
VYTPALGKAIAYAFLSRPVQWTGVVMDNTTFLNLEESGVIKHVSIDSRSYVRVPFVFVWCYLQQTCHNRNNKYSKFWHDILVGKDIDEWDVFNRNYIAFRLSLYACLDCTSISLAEFFQGAVVNIPVETKIKIPSMDQIKVSRIEQRYPTTKEMKDKSFQVGDCVLNASGAPFDAFVWLETTDDEKLLFVEQMKMSRFSASTRAINMDLINEEFNKANSTVAKYLDGADFVFMMLCRRDGNFDANQLPSKVAVVCNAQLRNFYGDAYYQRLKQE